MNEREALRDQIYGVNAHLNILHALEGLDPTAAGEFVGRAPHTIHQILHHMIYWQDITLARLRGENPASPPTAAPGWDFPPAPEDASAWEASIACMAEGLRGLEAILADPSVDLASIPHRTRTESVREEILMIQGHNSYHLGQIVSLRQGLGTWPPPRGGDTW